jgi:monothiol glutaredoxin
MADDITQQIDDEIRNNKIMIYMKGNRSFPQCGFSAATIEIFQELGKPFHTVDVLSEPAKRDAIKRYSNWPTIPQVYIDGKFVGGSDIVREMFATGDLQRLVDAAFTSRTS